jgi:transposase
MILVPATRPVYAALDPVDFRRSFDVLVAIAREQLGLDALRSAVVLFVNRDRTRCKLLFHDGSGLVILYKRLDAGAFRLPAALLVGDRSVRVEPRELATLLAGVARR